MKRTEELGEFIDFLKEELGWSFDVKKFDDRVLLQKYVFLSRFFGYDLGYYYNMYLYGPYSSDLANDYYNLPPGKERSEKYLDWDKKEDFINLVKGKKRRWLEIASTIMSLREYGYVGEDLRKKVAEIKNEDEDYVKKVYKELEGTLL